MKKFRDLSKETKVDMDLYLKKAQEENKLPDGHRLKISPSLLTSFRYLLDVSEEYLDGSFEDFKGAIRREERKDTVWTLRGKKFEELVMEGKIEEWNKYVLGEKIEDQKHLEIELEVDGVPIYLHGYTDVYDAENKRIIDVKRKNRVKDKEFLLSAQTHCYLLMSDEIETMEYLIAINTSTTPIPHKRTGERNLELKHEVYQRKDLGDIKKNVIDEIRNFITFLKRYDLYEDYVKAYSINEENIHIADLGVRLDRREKEALERLKEEQKERGEEGIFAL